MQPGDDRTQTHVTLTRGSLVSHYRIVELIGSGGMGEVYLAEDVELDRRVALKFLPVHVCQDADCRARFKREAQAAAKLDHPNIVTVYEVGEHRGRPFFSMQHVEGPSLRQVALGEIVPLERILEIGIQVCDGLHAAHESGITHRDIKPSNILIDLHGRSRIVDFGLASVLGTEQLTRTGSMLGTVGYMSPEQVRGERVDHRTDLFSLGVVLYELTAGHSPFRAETEAATLHAITSANPEPLARFRREVPSELQIIIDKALEKDRDERYQTAADVIADLRHLQRTLGAGTRAMEHSMTAAASRPARGLRWGYRAAALSVIAIAVVVVSLQIARRATPPGAESIPREKSIAVLPFVDMSPGRDQEYFGDGLAEDIIDALTQVPGLRVMARTSAFAFRGKQVDVREIGARLNVEHILEGSVRRDGSRIRVTAQLVTASDGYHLWSQRFDREMTDVFAIQDEISQAIVEKLRLRLSSDRPLVKRQTEDIEAYHLFLRGRHSVLRMTPESLTKGKGYLEQAIARDPNYALAYAGMAEHRFFSMIWGFMDPRQALLETRSAAMEALRRDDTLAEAHCMLGVVLGNSDFDWAGAEREFRRAIELNPASPMVRYSYGFWCLRPTGRLDEASFQMQQAVELDPLSPNYNAWLGHVYDIQGQSDLAIAQHRRAIELDPSLWRPHWLLGIAYANATRFEDAIAEAQEACELSGRNAPTLGILGMVYGLADRPSEARALLDELTTRARTTHVPPFAMAMACLGLGELDQALDWLEKGVEERDVLVVSIVKSGPQLAPLHGHPRYQTLLRKMNLEP